jgi:hypothetical protein
MVDEPERRKRITGRRETDLLLDHRLTHLEDLLKALGPAVSQVARIDDAVDDLEKWMEDERTARRKHDSDLLASIREIRGEVTKLETEIDEGFKAVRDEVGALGVDQKNGRRAMIVAMFGSVTVMTGTIVAAVVVVLSSSPQ